MLKLLAVAALAFIICLGGFVASTGIQVYALTILCTYTDDFDLVFNPSFYVAQVPRFSMLRPLTVSQSSVPLTLIGPVDRIILNINVTATNINGTVFFNGTLHLDTLADQKITFLREYEATAFTNTLTLQVDAYLLVDYSDQPDMERVYSGSWELTLP